MALQNGEPPFAGDVVYDIATVLEVEDTEIVRLCTLRGVKSDRRMDPKAPGSPARLGLAFSGGGIRSASINLGVIQALARIGILEQTHYISAVSGGSYGP